MYHKLAQLSVLPIKFYCIKKLLLKRNKSFGQCNDYTKTNKIFLKIHFPTMVYLIYAATTVYAYTNFPASCCSCSSCWWSYAYWNFWKKKKEAYSKATARKLGMEGECEMLALYTIYILSLTENYPWPGKPTRKSLERVTVGNIRTRRTTHGWPWKGPFDQSSTRLKVGLGELVTEHLNMWRCTQKPDMQGRTRFDRPTTALASSPFWREKKGGGNKHMHRYTTCNKELCS